MALYDVKLYNTKQKNDQIKLLFDPIISMFNMFMKSIIATERETRNGAAIDFESISKK